MARKPKTTKKQVEAEKAAPVAKPAPKAVSVEKMIEENHKAVHTSDYQTYLRKLMRDAARKF